MMFDITMSIVTYNNEKIIEKTIKSIVEHIYDINYKIYVIDNNSTDRTCDIVKEIDGNIELIENADNEGFGKAHNKVLNKLNSKYHIVVNPDIVIENKVIIDMYNYMEQNQDVGLLTPLVKGVDNEIQYLAKREVTFIDLLIRRFLPGFFKKRRDYFEMRDTNYNSYFKVPYATGCFMFFRTDIYKELEGFDENFFMYLEDADITKRVNKISKTIFFPDNYVIHEWQRGSHKSFKLTWVNIESLFYYFKKWGFKLY